MSVRGLSVRSTHALDMDVAGSREAGEVVDVYVRTRLQQFGGEAVQYRAGVFAPRLRNMTMRIACDARQ